MVFEFKSISSRGTIHSDAAKKHGETGLVSQKYLTFLNEFIVQGQ